jgi:nicotinate-nucleotide adenylyltransferase
MKKIGILAGSFDPVHDGHVAFAQKALLQLDKVFLLVEPRPRRKQGVKALEHRFEMARLAVKSNPKLGVIKLDQARFSPRDTMPLLEARFKGAEISLLFGDDVVVKMVDNIRDWPYVEELFYKANILIGTRSYKKDEVKERIYSLRSYGLNVKHKFIEINQPLTSSSKVRKQVRNGETPKNIHNKVVEYIKAQRLYSSVESCSK